MKKLMLTVTMFLASLAVNAQGIITVENAKSNVPVEQWYVIRDKEFNNTSFYYAEHEAAREELKRMLGEDDQSIEFPKGKDTVGDPYWIILYENEYLSHIYLSKDGNSEYSFITIVTE
tara:strand:+ start:40 stop:393 length:354 start_codon:yes stop_codon:yes gene_type:complete